MGVKTGAVGALRVGRLWGGFLAVLLAPRQARGCLAEGKPRPVAAQSGLRASQALPAGQGRKTGHRQGGAEDEPIAEPPANRVEVDAKRMFNEPVQGRITLSLPKCCNFTSRNVHEHF